MVGKNSPACNPFPLVAAKAAACISSAVPAPSSEAANSRTAFFCLGERSGTSTRTAGPPLLAHAAAHRTFVRSEWSGASVRMPYAARRLMTLSSRAPSGAVEASSARSL